MRLGLRRLALVAALAIGLGASASWSARQPQAQGGGAIAAVLAGRGPLDGLYVVNADGTGPRRLVSGEVVPASEAWWSPDGSVIAFQQGDLFVRAVPKARSRRVATARGEGFSGVSWSPDGKWIVYADGVDTYLGGNGRLRIVDARVGGVVPERALPTEGRHPMWSPSGDRIAFLRDEDGWGGALYTVRPDGGGLRRLRADVCWSAPSWSPDGNRLAFISRVPGTEREKQLAVLRVGDGGFRALAAVGSGACGTSWPRDGKRLAVADDGVFVINADGTGKRTVSRRSGEVSWSPEGTRLAISDGDIWVVGADGRNEHVVAAGFAAAAGSRVPPQWHPRGARADQLGGTPMKEPAVQTSSLVAGSELRARYPIKLLAFDSRRVALAYETPENCIEGWVIGSRRLVRFPVDGCVSRPEGESTSVREIAIAGSRLLWTYNMSTLHDYSTLDTATFDRPVAQELLAIEDEGELGRLHGDGELLVYGFFDYGKTHGIVSRVTGSQSIRVATDRAPLAVDAGRIAVAAPGGGVELLDVRGRLLRRFSDGGNPTPNAALQGTRLALQRGQTVLVFDTETGRRTHIWPLAGGTLDDIYADLAVYVEGRVIHVLDVDSGRDVTIRPPGGEVLAQIERPGLVYAYRRAGSGRVGRVVFVPAGKVRQLVAG